MGDDFIETTDWLYIILDRYRNGNHAVPQARDSCSCHYHLLSRPWLYPIYKLLILIILPHCDILKVYRFNTMEYSLTK